MASADWEEVKRLAADFQRAQLSSSLQRLSERNVVEIISKLCELHLLEVYHTNDGKEYVTPSQLSREIHDETIISGGRVSTADLVKTLSVDHSLIDKQAQILADSQDDLHYVLGQVVSKEYMDGIAEEINEKLQLIGMTTISDIVKRYDLPGDFVQEMILERLGSIIRGQQDSVDPNVLYTEGFEARHHARVRGVLSAITRPTSVANIVAKFNLQEKLFFTMAEKLIASGRICGTLTGSRQITQANYLPSIYTRTQNEWVDNFLKQNGYLELQALRRLEIPNPEVHIKHRYKDHDLTFLGDMCVGPGLKDQVEASIDDAILTASWVDIYPLLPSSFSIDECSQLVGLCLKLRGAAGGGRRGGAGGRVVGGTVVVSDVLITRLSEHLTQLMPQKAKAAVERGAFKEQVAGGKVKMDDDDRGKKDKKEDRRKRAAGGKSGGGTQGRETKTKATKNKIGRGKKHAAHHDSDSDEHTQKHNQDNKLVEFLSAEEMKTEVTNFPDLEDCPEDVVEELTQDLLRPLTQQFQDVARGVFLATLNAEGGEGRRRTHQQLQDKVSALLTTIKLSEKSLKVFEEDKQVQLRRHLLRTQCTELVNELLLNLAHHNHIDLPQNTDLTPEMRVKIIHKLDEDAIPPLQNVNKTLTGAGLEEFHKVVDDAVAATGIMLKKKDNKKDRQVLLSHRTALLEQLEASLDPPLTLHLACLVLFQAVTGNMLHASGKFVPHILAFLKTHLPEAHFSSLHQYQELVIKSLTSKGDNEEDSSIKLELESLTPSVKEIAITFKKASGGSQTTEEQLE